MLTISGWPSDDTDVYYNYFTQLVLSTHGWKAFSPKQNLCLVGQWGNYKINYFSKHPNHLTYGMWHRKLPSFPDTPHRFSDGSIYAIRGHPCSNARIVSMAMCECSTDLYNVEEVCGWMRKRMHSIKDGYSLLKQSCYRWGALSIGQPFGHSQTTAYVASLWLSWMFVINKRSICYTQVQYTMLV